MDSIKVKFGSGFNVLQVTTGFESRQIILGDVPPTVVPADITAALEPFGDVISVLPVVPAAGGPVSAYKVAFALADSAAKAAEALNDSQLFDTQVTACVADRKKTGIGGGTLYDGDVLFELPTPQQVAFVGYGTEEQARKAMANATKGELRSMKISAKIYEGLPSVGPVNVRYDYMPPDASTKDLARFGEFESHMFDTPKYPSIRSAIQGLRRNLSQYGDVTLNALPGPYTKMFRVWAHFGDPDVAAAACNALHAFCPYFTGKQRIFAHHVRSIRYTLPHSVFDSLAYDINLLHSYVHDNDGTGISVFDRRPGLGPQAPVIVKLVSRNMASLTRVKTAFDRLLRGEKVTDNGRIVWNDFFGSRAGIAFFEEVERAHPRVKVNRDSRRRTLALFGPEPGRSRAREEIIARAKLLQARRRHQYPIAGKIVGVFMSADLDNLQRELGNENVWFDLSNKQLVVCGDADAQRVAQLAVKHAHEGRAGRVVVSDGGCPVCLSEPSYPVTLACGHRWCKACLCSYLNAAVDLRAFPLTCLGADAKCAHAVPLTTAMALLPPDEFDALATAAFLAYVQARPNEFRFCPTPDCPQVYRRSDRPRATLQCPVCLVRVCPRCDGEHHADGRSCVDRAAEDDALFATWKAGHDVKDCPGCQVPIERAAGCNHMTCASCRIHICWQCLETFTTSGEVYDHMRNIHGGIGL